MKSIVIFCALIVLLGNACAASDFDWERAGSIAVQSDGRVKPLDTFARELVTSETGQSSFRGQPPLQTYFLWMADGEHWGLEPVVYLPKSTLRTRLGLDGHRGNYFSLAELQDARGLMDIATEGQTRSEAGEKPTFVQTKAVELLNRMHLLSSVFSHEAPLFVPTDNGDPQATWQSMPTLLSALEDSTKADSVAAATPQNVAALELGFAAMYNAVRDERGDIFNTAASVFTGAQQDMLAAQPNLRSRLTWDLRFNRWQPFLWAQFVLLAGGITYLFSLRKSLARLKSPGMMALLIGLALYTAGMAMRAMIAGRAPWSNMYESLLAIGWALTLIAAIFEIVRRDRLFGTIGCLFGFVLLGLAHAANLDRSVNPLVPALQSYWLNYHVIITLTGYACFALAMGVGHAVLISAVRAEGAVTPTVTALSKANLRIVQVGSLFLITGILLGAVWANVSWGRFWGWDPKETWALICWFVYIVLLHGRSAGWLTWRGMAAWSVGAFPIVIMTYYGVNYYLSGLHSYGAGSAPGIPWQMFAYVAVEAAFLVWALFQLRSIALVPSQNLSATAASATISEVQS